MTPGKLKKYRDNRAFNQVIEHTDAGRPDFRIPAGCWSDLFGRRAPLTLELACGRGEYTLELARRFPEQNFVGVDIKGSRVWNGARRAIDEGLENVRFLRIYIQELDQWFGAGEADRIWITFPDPFPKRRDERRRLTSPRFLALYRKLLKPGGSVHFKTDSESLFRYTLEVLEKQGIVPDQQIDDVYGEGDPEPPLGILTTYEKRHLQEDRTIRYLRFRVTPRLA